MPGDADLTLGEIVDTAADALDVASKLKEAAGDLPLTYREIRGILSRAVREAYNYGANEGKADAHDES
jgi:hypothetical protein